MVLAELGNRISEAISNFKKSTKIDEQALDLLLKEVCNALLQSDVNVHLLSQLRKNVKASIDFTTIGKGQNVKRLIESSVCRELVDLLNPKVKPWTPKKNVPNVVMFVGLQGAGKTTTCSKYAYYYKSRGWKTCMICADTFRAGAFDQMQQNCVKAQIPYYGNYDEIDPAVIAAKGVDKFKSQRFEIIIVDTSGRHKQESELFEEMIAVSDAIKPSNVCFVMDASIGQACEAQARAFKESVDVGSVIVTKLDSHAKGGGALSAIAATKSPIIFIGTGEQMTDFQAFKTESFVSKLLGRGDLQSLVEVLEVFNNKIDMASFERDMKQGKFTFRNLQDQFSALSNVGPVDQILSAIPGFKPEIFGISKDESGSIGNNFTIAIKSWMTLMDSMTNSELDSPDPVSLFKKEPSRTQRIARGCGISNSDASDKIKKMILMLNTFKKVGPILSQFKAGGTNTMPDMGQMNKMSSELMKNMNPAVIKQMGGQHGFSNLLRSMGSMQANQLGKGKFS